MEGTTPWLGWHWLAEDRRLRYGDRREVRVGETLTCDGPLSLCARGLHACARAIDSLQYAPGPVVCRVRLSGEILSPANEDKACATERTVLAMADAAQLINELALQCAERVLPLFEEKYPNDKRPRLALEAKRKWLAGEITDSELDMANSNALESSRASCVTSARAVAWAIVRTSARASSMEGDWQSVSSGYWESALASALASDMASAWVEMNEDLERRLFELLCIQEN